MCPGPPPPDWCGGASSGGCGDPQPTRLQQSAGPDLRVGLDILRASDPAITPLRPRPRARTARTPGDAQTPAGWTNPALPSRRDAAPLILEPPECAGHALGGDQSHPIAARTRSTPRVRAWCRRAPSGAPRPPPTRRTAPIPPRPRSSRSGARGLGSRAPSPAARPPCGRRPRPCGSPRYARRPRPGM